MKKKAYWLGLFTLIMIFLLSACAGGGDSSSEGEHEAEAADIQEADFVIATLSDAARLDPHLTTDVPSYNVEINLFDTLVKKDEDEEVIPNLAKSWKNIDDVTWEFELRDDVIFHDGEKFDAEVVKKNFDRILDKDVAAPRAFLFEVIEEIEVIDEYTVQLKTSFPFAPLLMHLSHPVGSMVSPKSIDEDYAAMKDGEEAGTVINEHPVGTGFFKFDKWDHGTEIKLVKNADYWGEPVQLKSVTFKAIPEGGTRLAELETGYAHLIEPVQPSEVSQIEDSENGVVDEKLSSTLAYVGFNLEKEPFNDKRVRQAISMLIDTDAILQGIYEGYGIEATGPLAPGVFGHDDQLKPLEYDVEKAKKLLKEAGYEEGFKTTIWTNDNKQRMDMAVLIQDSLKQANITASVEVVEWGAYLDQTANGDHDMFILGLTNPVGDADYFLTQLFHSENLGEPGNRTFYQNKEVDGLIEEARQEIDEEKRQALYTEIQEILIDEAPMVYVHHQAYLTGLDKKVKNYWIDASGYYQLQDVYVESK